MGRAQFNLDCKLAFPTRVCKTSRDYFILKYALSINFFQTDLKTSLILQKYSTEIILSSSSK